MFLIISKIYLFLFRTHVIYNMVMFYDEYSSETFIATIRQYLNTEFVQPKTAQIESSDLSRDVTVIVQSKSELMLKKLGLALP